MSTREEQKDMIRSCQCRSCKFFTRNVEKQNRSCEYGRIMGETRTSVAIRMGEDIADWTWCKLYVKRQQKQKKSPPVSKTGQAQEENTQLQNIAVSEECQDPDAARRAKKAAQSREYYATHKDQHAEWARRYRKQNRDRYNAYMREYYAKKALEQIRRELNV